MAGRINSTRLIRKIHLIASLFIFVFALLYIFTGLVISKGNWFHHHPDKNTTTVSPLSYTPDTTKMNQFGREIKQQLDITGRMSYRRNWKNELVFTYYKPMVRNVVTTNPQLDSLTLVRTENINFHEANKRIHRVHGYQGGIKYVVWALLLDLSAVAMIVFAITGFLIWFKWRRQMQLGWFIFILPLILLMLMVWYLK